MRSPVRGSSTIHIILLSFACTLVLFLLSSVAVIGTSSEAREAHIIQVMVNKGDWLLPTRNGLIPSKPPLHHWVAAGAGVAVGKVSEVVARLPSVVAGGLVLLLTGLLAANLARRVGGPSGGDASSSFESGPAVFGIAAMLILGTTYGFTYMGTDARVDMTFTFFLVAACSVMLRRLFSHVAEPRALVNLYREQDFFWFYLLCGLAVLAKGPLGIVLPLLLAAAATLSLFSPSEIFRNFLRPRWGWLVFVAVVSPWYVAGALQGSGGGLLSRQLVFENLQRFTGGEEVNSESFWFYFGSFARVAAPWSLLSAWCVLQWMLGRQKNAAASSREDRFGAAVRGLGYAFAAGFLFFSLASGKRHSYLLPLFPFLSIALAAVVLSWWNRQTRGVHARLRLVVRIWALGSAVILLFLPTLLLLPLVFPPRAIELGFPMQLTPLFFRAWLMLGTTSVAGFLAFYMLAQAPSWKNPVRAAWLIAFGAFTLLSTGTTLGNAVKNELKSFPAISSQVLGLLGEKPLSVIRSKGDEFFDPVLFYIEREATLIPPEVSRVPCGMGMVLARREFFDTFVAFAGTHGVELGEFHVFRSLGSELQGNEQDQIVLFSCQERSSRDEAESSIRLNQPREVLGT